MNLALFNYLLWKCFCVFVAHFKKTYNLWYIVATREMFWESTQIYLQPWLFRVDQRQILAEQFGWAESNRPPNPKEKLSLLREAYANTLESDTFERTFFLDFVILKAHRSQQTFTCTKLIIETLENLEKSAQKLIIKWRSGVFIVHFKHISHLLLVFLLLTFNMEVFAGFKGSVIPNLWVNSGEIPIISQKILLQDLLNIFSSVGFCWSWSRSLPDLLLILSQ